MTTEDRVLAAIRAYTASHRRAPSGFEIARMVPQRFLWWEVPLAIGTTYLALDHLLQRGDIRKVRVPLAGHVDRFEYELIDRACELED